MPRPWPLRNSVVIGHPRVGVVPEINDITKEHPEHPAHPHSDVNRLASFKFAEEASADSGHLAHPHFDNAKVPGTVMSDAASDQFVFEKGHDKVADVKPDMIRRCRHPASSAHDANAVGALDPNHTTAPQDMTKVSCRIITAIFILLK